MNDDNENNCGICQCSLETGRTKIVHKNNKVWKHEFHKPCIDAWIKTCIQAGRRPSCPLCPSFVIPDDKIPSDMKPKPKPKLVALAPAPINEQTSTQLARTRWAEILRHINYGNLPPLYTGIMICSRGRPCVHMFNPDNGINPAWNLGRIKEHVRRANRIVYSHKGMFDADNLAHNTTLSNWTQMKYPELRIVDAYYGIPSQSGRLGKFDIEMTDDKTVEEMYIEYQTLIRENIMRSDLSETIKGHMRDIYYETNLEFNHPTGPDDPGHYDKAFVSRANPTIPVEHRRYRRYSQSTEYSLMWLMVDVEYVV